ncbi:hypothetical protein A3B26_03330 [Candidatus Giovannonibacteria bacterium RIFCSPLOWO2_01_FULL_48_47]|nr:MAG: hypothetical protein A3D61_01845 [Candidatus Giovannonibacteria bacterium RIFCSPHIGHO2_02_FULL_48_15]OGF88439.1 MAG: hypothetical protein A3B26_03330 [Candidatus Giovannonibacteria bacterium RIFCSPLOWO2_01_FULL_48_47]OGF95794.1 MAG: hypothetical protein A2613_04020 [Candidatus Giovannonibacteria bacterium RIFOXYD1_FULL_48_21]HBT81428.1 hypothetical protein [Candidatus Giovannonibacteria bacterium]
MSIEIPLKIKRGQQLFLIPAVQVARNFTEISNNIALLRETRTNFSFLVELRDSRGLYANGQASPNTNLWIFDFLFSASRGEASIACDKCDKDPILFFMRCACGNYVWCRKHFDRELFWDHYLHYCSPECCKFKHPSNRFIRRSRTEIESLLSMSEISVSKMGNGKGDFVVKLRQRNELEISARRQWLSSYAAASL